MGKSKDGGEAEIFHSTLQQITQETAGKSKSASVVCYTDADEEIAPGQLFNRLAVRQIRREYFRSKLRNW